MAIKWKSDDDCRDYYRNKWLETVKLSGVSNDEKYMDVIYAKMDDISNRADCNKYWWRFLERALIIVTAVISLLNVISAAEITAKISFWANIIAAIGAAMVSVLNGFKMLAAYKETWLRHSKSRSQLDMECLCFANDSGDYAIINNDPKLSTQQKAAAKIEKFKENTTTITQNDYDRFYGNMSKD